MTINEIIAKYTNGEADLETTNEALKKADAGFYLDPMKNKLTEEEIANCTAGLLDTGTGSLDKVTIKDGHLTNCDCGEMIAYVLMNGKTYKVEGTKIIGL